MSSICLTSPYTPSAPFPINRGGVVDRKMVSILAFLGGPVFLYLVVDAQRLRNLLNGHQADSFVVVTELISKQFLDEQRFYHHGNAMLSTKNVDKSHE